MEDSAGSPTTQEKRSRTPSDCSVDCPTIQGEQSGELAVHDPPVNSFVSAPSKLQIGDQIDRYMILSQLGEGGMGVVYTAYDPDLNRKIAIKLVHHRAANGGLDKSTIELARTRMLHEARSMARLSHPNVVTIFDVGLHESQVFIAMELIDGITLTNWLGKKNHSWPHILRIFCEAGKGLSGAHDAGLTHRDFKPDNVLIANDGQVFVADLGLVYISNNSPGSPRPNPSMPLDSAQITTGVHGTPAYMSPEQHRGEKVTHASDQFSFCVSLFQAIYGVRPFLGRNLGEIYSAIESRTITSCESSKKAPRWLRKVILQGLSFDSTERYPSMQALLHELSRHQRTQNAKSIFLLCAFTGIGATVGIQELSGSKHSQDCTQITNTIDNIWTQQQRQTIQEQFSQSELPNWQRNWKQIDSTIIQRITDWESLMNDLCLANENHHLDSVTPRDLQVLCLQNQREELQAYAQILETAPNSTLAKAAKVAQELPTSEECENTTIHRIHVASYFQDPQTRLEVQQLDTNLAKVDVMLSLNQSQTLLPLLDDLERTAQSLHIRPALTKIYFARATIAYMNWNHKQVEELAHIALTHAEASHNDFLTAKAALQMIQATIMNLHISSDISEEIRHAEAHIRRCNSPLFLKARMLHLLSLYNFMLDGTHRKNQVLMQQEAVSISERENGPNHWDTMDAKLELSISLARFGDYEAALSNYFQLIEVSQKNRYDNILIHIYYCISVAYFHLDQFSLAKASIQKSISLAESKFESDNLGLLAEYYSWEAELSLLLGQHREALSLWTRAVNIDKNPDSITSIQMYNIIGLAETQLLLGNVDQSLKLIRSIDRDELIQTRNWRWDVSIARIIRILLKAEQTEQANEVYQKLIDSGFDFSDIDQLESGRLIQAVGDLKLAQGRTKSAYDYHKQALEHTKKRFKKEDSPALIRYEQALARSSFALGETHQAIDWQLQAIKRIQDGRPHAPHLLSSAFLNLGLFYHDAQNWEQAYQAFRQALRHKDDTELDPKLFLGLDQLQRQTLSRCGQPCENSVNTTPPTQQ